jgi:hypothetical protein
MKISIKSALTDKLCNLTEIRFIRESVFALAGIVVCWPHLLLAQHTAPNSPKVQEQSVFNEELEIDPIQRPAHLTKAAISALSKDERVVSCLENEGLRPEQLPANWFIASEIRLDGKGGHDLIVLPGDRLPETPPGEPSQNVCLVGANTAQFWVLRKTRVGFTIVLSQIAHGLDVLQTKTNGLRDIRLNAVVGGYGDTIDYTFDGRSYEIAERSSELLGAEVPLDLSNYETREPLVQLDGQPADPIRATARAWVWQRWHAHKLSYLEVRTIADDGTQETATYFVNRTATQDWQIVVKVHRIHSVPGSSTKRHKVIENELAVASKVQRIEPVTDDSRPVRVWPESEELHDSEYKLQFLDYADRTVTTL